MHSSRQPSLRKTCVVVLMLATYANAVVLAAPVGGRVVSGQASFQQSGNLTTITAGNRSVINYSSFNIAPNETVRFVQPGATSTVLNRVIDPNPTNIFGRLESNGIVTIANPYGVFFQNGSVINVGGLYAGAGNISASDFTAGKIHFTDLKGDVRNDGVLAAQNQIALMGANVTNNGTMTSTKGLAMMVSGQDVYIGARNSNIFVQANGKAVAPSSAASGSITNGGTVAAPRVLLGAGDMYSTAIANTGLLQGRSVSVNAGRNGTATVGGRIDASAARGQGGSIQVTGGNVALRGAKLDASGSTGGGSVRVGGDFHGGGTLAHSTTTTVDAATTIHADATGKSGNGGTVVLWSDGATSFAGQISARGGTAGGNGGTVEVSSHNSLGFYGTVDTSAPAGKIGSLLLDPSNIEITAGGTTPAVPVPTATANTPEVAPTTLTIAQASLEASTTDITLTASNDIRVDALSGGTLTLQANATFTAGANAITLAAPTGTASVGSFVMANPTDTIVAPGHTITISASGASVGATPPAGTVGTGINGDSPYAIDIGGINTSSTTGNGGAVVLQITGNPSTAPIRMNGDINTSSSFSSGNGGNLTVNSAGVPAAIAVAGGLNASGGATGTGGAISLNGSLGVTLGGAVTGGSLLVTGPGFLNGGAVTTTGAQTYNGAVQLGAATTLGSTGNGDISFSSTVDGSVADAYSLAVNTGGQTIFGDQAGGTSRLLSLTTDLFGTAGEATQLHGGVNTLNDQLYNDPVTLNADTVLTSAGGAITFGRTVNGGFGLTLNTGGTMTLGGAVGNTAPLTGLTAGSGLIALNGGVVNTNGATGQNYNGPVTLGLAGGTAAAPVATTLTSNGGPIVFASTVEGDAGLTQALVLTGASTQTFRNTVGFTNALASLSTGTANLNGGTVRTNGGQTYLGAVTLGLAGATPVAPMVTTLTSLNSGEIVFYGALDGTAAAGGAGAQSLTINTAGNKTFAGLVGSSFSLSGLTTATGGQVNFNAVGSLAAPSVTTTGTQTYNGDVRLGNATVLVGPALTLGTTLDGAGATGQGSNGAATNDLTLEFTNTPVRLSGGLTSNGTATGLFNNVNNFVSTNGVGVTLVNNFTTAGSQSYSTAASAVGAALLLGTPTSALSTFTLTSTAATAANGAITIGKLDSTPGSPTRALTISTVGQTIFNGLVGSVTALTGLTVNAGGSVVFNVPGGGTTVNTLDVSGVAGGGAQVYNSPVTLQQATALTSAGNAGATVAFGSTVDGPGALTVNSAGTFTLSQLVGNTSALEGLTVTAPNTVFAINAGASTVNRGAVNVGAGGVTISGPVNFGFSGSTLTDPTHPSIVSVGAQNYGSAGGNATLSGNTSLVATGAGSGIKFNGTVDGAFGLSVSAAGDEGFAQAIGGTTPLASLRTDAFGTVGGSVIFGPSVGTVRTGSDTGADVQTFSDAVVLQGNTTLRSSNAAGTAAGSGAITFNRTVDGTDQYGQSLTTVTSGTVTFAGLVGHTAPLDMLMTGFGGAPGTTLFSMNLGVLPAGAAGSGVAARTVTVGNAAVFDVLGSTQANPSIATTGAQMYTGSTVALEQADTVLQGSMLTLPAINAQGHDLTLDFSPGTVEINGNYVNIRNFSSVGNGRTLIGNSGGATTFTTTGFQYYGNDVSIQSDVTLASGNSNITFQGSLGGGYALILQPGTGTVFFNGPVGSPAPPVDPLRTLTVSGNTSIGGGSVTTQQEQNYNGTLTLTANTTLNVLGSSLLTVGSLAGGGYNLTVNGFTSKFGVITNGGDLLFKTGGGAAFTSTVDARSLTVALGTASLSGNVTTNSAAPGQSYVQLQLNGNVTLRDNASGPITSGAIDGSGAGGQNLALSTDGTITLNGPVGAGIALGSLATSGLGQTVFNVNGGVTVTTFANGTTTGAQTYGNNVVLAQNTTLSSLGSGAATNAGAITFNGRVNSATDATPVSLTVRAGNGQTVFGPGATVNANALNIGGALVSFNAPVGGIHKLDVLTVGRSGVYAGGGSNTIDLNGGLVNSTLGQTYNDPVTLSADTTLGDTGGKDIVFTTTINGDGVAARSLTLSTTGAVAFGGLIGNVVAINGLTVTAGAGTTFGMSLVGQPAGKAGVNVGAGGVTINGAAKFAVAGGSLLDLTHVTVRSAGSQAYNGAVSLGQDSSFQSTNDGIAFDGPVNGAVGLAANASGNVVFGGIVGGTAPLTSLTTGTLVASTGQTRFNANLAGQGPGIAGVRVGGSITINNPVLFNVAGSTSARPSVETFNGGTQTYQGTATVSADTVLAGDASGAIPPAGGGYAGGGAIVFGADVAGTGGAPGLSIFTGAGTTTFQGAVSVASLNVTGAQVSFGGPIVGLGALLVAPNGAAGGPIVLNGGTATGYTVQTTAGQTYGSALQLGADTILTNGTANADLLFTSTVDGAHALTLDTGGRIIFNGLVGNTAALTGLTTNAVATPGLGTQFNMNVGGASAGVLVNGAVVINDPVLFNVGGSSLARPSILTLGNNPQTYNGAANLTGNTVLVSASVPPVGGVYAGGGAVNLLSAAGITGANGSSLSIRAGAGTTTLSGTINVASIDLGGGQATVNGPITLPGGRLSIEPNDASPANTIRFNGGVLTTAGAQAYNTAVVLGADTILTSSNTTGDGGNLVFASTVDGQFALTLNTSGDEVFNGVLGGNQALASLTTDATGIVGGTARFNMGAANGAAGVNVTGAVTINDAVSFNVNGGVASVATGGAQRYVGAATLGRDTTLTGGSIAFASTVDGAQALTLTSPGLQSFGGVVGGTNALTGLTTSGGTTAFNIDLGAAPGAPAAVRVNGPLTVGGPAIFNVAGSSSVRPTVLTLGNFTQNYGGAVTLPQNAFLASAGTGAVNFGATVDGPGALTLSTLNRSTFNGAVGTSTPLLALTVGPGPTLINGGTLITQNVQTYSGVAQIGADTILTSLDATNGNGQIFFGAPLDGAHALTINAPALVTFGGPVGVTDPLASLRIVQGPSGTTLLKGGSVTTAGFQTYGGTVVLGYPAILRGLGTAGDSTITFQNRVEGGFALTINTPGDVLFNGAVGGTQPLASLTTGAGTTTVAGGLVTTTGAQTYGNPVRLGAATVLNSTNAAGGGITFAGTLDGAHALTINTGAPIVLNGAVGGGVALGSLATQGGGRTTVRGGFVTTTGAQNYGNPVLLAANGNFTGSGVAFRGTVDGGYVLRINTPGQAFFGGPVGGDAPLAQVITSADSTTVFAGAGVTTTGLQTYGGTAVLNADAALTSAANGDITFAGTVNGPYGLTTSTNGNTTFNAAVGDAAPLTNLTVAAGGGTTIFTGSSVRTTGFQTYNNAVTLSAAAMSFTSNDGALTFGGPVDAARAGGTALTLDTTGVSRFNGDVGADNSLASLLVTGALVVGGERIVTVGDQRYMSQVAANPLTAPDTQLTATVGNIRFDGNVTANGSLAVTANRVGAQRDITTTGDLVLESRDAASPLLLLLGNNYASASGVVRFNTQQAYNPQSAFDNNSTIILGNAGLVTIQGTGFQMGFNQKILSLGSLNINVGRGTATLGDIAAKNSLRVNAGTVVLEDREAGASSVSGGRNNGLNFAAPNGISFGGAAIVFAGTGNRMASFVTSNGNVDIVRVQGISLFKDTTLSNQFPTAAPSLNELARLSPIPNQPVAGGTQSLDTAAALSGALPDQKPVDVAADIAISASQMEELQKLGIHPRLAQKSERGSGASKRALFAQLVDGQDPDNYGRLQPIKGGVSRLEPSDYVVVVDRMGEREVQSILTSFENLYGKKKEKAPEIGGSFQTAFNDYTVAKQTADPAGFADYLSAQKGKYPAVDTAVRGFDDLFGHIEHLGLTGKEVAKSEEHITSDLGVSGVSPEDMVKTINALRKKLPPEQKAASTKAPASAPAANPAPASTIPNPLPPVAKPVSTLPTPAPTEAPAIPEMMGSVPPANEAPTPPAAAAPTPDASPAPTPESTPAPTPAPTPTPAAAASPLSTTSATRSPDRTQKTARRGNPSRPAHRVGAATH